MAWRSSGRRVGTRVLLPLGVLGFLFSAFLLYRASPASEIRGHTLALAAGLAMLFVSVFVVFRFVARRRRTAITGRPVNRHAAPLSPADRELQREILDRKRAEQALRENEERFRLAMEATSDGLWDWDVRSNRCYRSPGYHQMFGYEPEEFPTTGEAWLEHVHPDDREQAHRVNVDCIENRADGFEVEFRMKTRSGEWKWILARAKAVSRDAGGRALRIVGTHVDITERKRAEELLRDSEERYRRIVDTANEGIWVLDGAGGTTFVNARMAEMLGYRVEEMIGRAADEFLFEEDLADQNRQMEIRRQGIPGRYERRLRRKDGQAVWVIVSGAPLLDARNRFCGSFGMLTDITLRKQAEEELRTAARIDRLTGLANRNLLHDRLNRALLRAGRLAGYRFAILYIDLDGFKQINDGMGHQLGDLLLAAVAQRLREEVRAADTISREATGHTAARFGGDEFVVLLDGIHGEADAQAVADRLLTALAQPYVLQGHEVVCTSSIGVVVSGGTPAQKVEDLLRNADTALYEAKQAGKGRCVMFDAAVKARVQARSAIQNDLREALHADQLLLHYQPILSLDSGRLEGFESLPCWRHPERGIVSAAEFISIAEDSGLILSAEEWALREACRQLSEWWKARGTGRPPSIRVNLSGLQLLRSELPGRLSAILRETGVAGGAVHLEIPESAVMGDAQAAGEALKELKRVGFRIDLDDFGTGPSSLPCLHELPIDVVKIDRSFIADMEKGPEFVEFVQGIILLARSFRISVAAVGVESPGQLALLRSLRCPFAQGPLFADPLPAARAIELADPWSLPGAEAAARPAANELQYADRNGAP